MFELRKTGAEEFSTLGNFSLSLQYEKYLETFLLSMIWFHDGTRVKDDT